MFSNILLYLLISVVFIFVIHSLYEFFKEMLTIPTEKDMIEKPRQLYTNLYNSMNNKEHIQNKNNKMKDELKEYLRELKTSSNTKNNTSISNIEPEPADNLGFSAF